MSQPGTSQATSSSRMRQSSAPTRWMPSPAQEPQPDPRDPPLLRAVAERSTRKVDVLLRSGESTTKRGKQGFTAMHWAAMRGDTRIIKILAEEYKADVNPISHNGSGHTPLDLARTNGYFPQTVALLKKYGGVGASEIPESTKQAGRERYNRRKAQKEAESKQHSLDSGPSQRTAGLSQSSPSAASFLPASGPHQTNSTDNAPQQSHSQTYHSPTPGHSVTSPQTNIGTGQAIPMSAFYDPASPYRLVHSDPSKLDSPPIVVFFNGMHWVNLGFATIINNMTFNSPQALMPTTIPTTSNLSSSVSGALTSPPNNPTLASIPTTVMTASDTNHAVADATSSATAASASEKKSEPSTTQLQVASQAVPSYASQGNPYATSLGQSLRQRQAPVGILGDDNDPNRRLLIDKMRDLNLQNRGDTRALRSLTYHG